MPYMDPFVSIITTTKKNNRYYGPTESKKVACFLSEVRADLDTLFQEVNDLRSNLDALASGYFNASDDMDKLDTIRRSTLELSQTVNERFFIQGDQSAIY
jgi:hypothetical protein